LIVTLAVTLLTAASAKGNDVVLVVFQPTVRMNVNAGTWTQSLSELAPSVVVVVVGGHGVGAFWAMASTWNPIGAGRQDVPPIDGWYEPAAHGLGTCAPTVST
jgi:hypothetical protein